MFIIRGKCGVYSGPLTSIRHRPWSQLLRLSDRSFKFVLDGKPYLNQQTLFQLVLVLQLFDICVLQDEQ